jgi:hypothetical protein
MVPRIALVALLGVSGALLASGPATASLYGSASLKLSGAGHGSLHLGSGGFCTNARNEGVDIIGLVGSVAGFKKAATWSLTVASQSTKAGTYKIAADGDAPGGQLDPMVKHSTPAESEASILNSQSGEYSVHGDKGTLDVTFGTGNKAIKVQGSWNC